MSNRLSPLFCFVNSGLQDVERVVKGVPGDEEDRVVRLPLAVNPTIVEKSEEFVKEDIPHEGG